MDKCKILIIDDSALMRRVVSDIIATDDFLEVVDTAGDGIQGLDLLIRNNGKYDIVLLDVNMPKMNGLEVLKKVKKYKLKCKVIMVSTLVKEGAMEAILALENGAIDLVLKPSNTSGENIDDFRERLLESVRVAAGMNGADEEEKEVIGDLKNTPAKKKNGEKLIALACSTGGPKSLKEVIPKLPNNMDAPMILVQHMPAGFTKSLSERLNELSDVEVKEAEQGDVLEKGKVYIAPGGKQMRVAYESGKGHVIALSDEEPREGLRPCANIMYESLADSKYDEITCVVLTGMGADGTIGIGTLSKTKDVYVISQDAKSCVVYGMPRAVINAGLADEVQPLDKISEAIIKNVGVQNDGR